MNSLNLSEPHKLSYVVGNLLFQLCKEKFLMDKSLRNTILALPLSSRASRTEVGVPFRSAKQAHIAMQVIQQLACSLVQSRLDAGAAQAVDGVLDGIQVGLAGCCLAGRGWAPVQAQNGLLHLI